jgi:RHS repeat-associated protein
MWPSTRAFSIAYFLFSEIKETFVRRIQRVVLCVALALLPAISFGQVATGTPPFSSFGGGPFDTINLGNLNAHFSVPVLSKAGRGVAFSYSLGYDSSVWHPVTSNGVTSWGYLSNWGWTVQSNALGASYTTRSFLTSCSGVQILAHYIVTYTDPLSTTHPFHLFLDPCDNGNIFTQTTSDGSGWTLTFDGSLQTLAATSRGGATVVLPYAGYAPSYTDTNGNQLTASGGNYFDTLSGTTPVLSVAGNATPASPTTLSYAAPSGGNATYTVNYTQYTVATNFGVSGITEYGPLSQALVSNITLPDTSSYAFTYEQTPGSCTPLSGTFSSYCITARIASVTLPTGGKVTYAYSGGSNGIESDGSTAGLTRTLAPGGTWRYARTQVSGAHWQTQITSPPDPVNSGSASDVTVIDFQQDGNTTTPSYNFYETQRQVNQGTSTLLLTITTCYNGHYASCPTTAVSSPVANTTVYTTLPNGSTRASVIGWDPFGRVSGESEYNYGVVLGSAPSHWVRDTLVTYTGSGGLPGQPGSVTVYDTSSGTQVTLASTTYTYDEGTPTATSGTPQHVAVTGSRGNLTTVTTSTSGTSSLTNTLTYYDTGNPKVIKDVNATQTTYVYGSGSCGNSFATSINEPLSLSRSMAWNCTGGIATQVTDENGNNVTANYTDSDFWRPANVQDQLTNQTNLSYTGQTAVEASLQGFNGGNSTFDSRTTVDGFGRPILNQQLQAPGSTNYDTLEADYNNFGQPNRSTMPFQAAAGGTSSTAPGMTTTYDALGRQLSVTDADGGQVSYTYINNDVLQKTSGSQTFQKQLEYDALGRLTSVCEISSTLPGVGACAQTSAKNGLWTKYTYDGFGRVLTVTQNAQASAGSQQTRSFVYDMLGRMTSESNPETSKNGANGTITYAYDSISPCGDGTNHASVGDLVQKKDNAGNTTCYSYDALHRLVTAGNTSVASTTLRKFFYDSKSSYPTGVTVTNGKTRMLEAQTFNASNLSAFVTDEFFSYSPRGELTDLYEATPHSGSGVYYHTTASYWPTGALKALSGIPGAPTTNYGANGAGLDGEGRYTQVTASSGTSPVVNTVTYSSSSTTNPLGALTGVTFGSADSDSFTYDPNTGRLNTYTFSVNGKTDTGTLFWNTNGTVQTLAIVDSIPGTSDTQTCNYQHDDVERVSSALCGSIWSQNFTYDSFGNITKSGNATFSPLYSSTTNQFTSIPGVTVKYDANGNLLTDNLNSYTWDPNWGNPTTVNTTNLIYDALGRMVERQNGSTYTEILYSPVGKTALMNGQTLVKAFISLPGGTMAVYNSTGLAYYRHTDWLNSSRLTSSQARGLYSSSAYAPFGELYKTSGTPDPSFTGQNSDTASTLYDFTFREHSPSQGRWISPDPAGLAAADPTNPQSWNRYAYVLNSPLAAVDPFGLAGKCYPDDNGGKPCPPPPSPPPVGVGAGECHNPATGGTEACNPHSAPVVFDGSAGTGPDGRQKNGKVCPPKSAGLLSLAPRGIGVLLNGEISAGGALAGGIAQGAYGSGVYVDNNGNISTGGLWGSGGAALYAGSNSIATPQQSKVDPFVVGAYAGGGGGVYLTNSQSQNQLGGPFAQWNASIGWGPGYSFSLAYDNVSGIWIFSVTNGPGVGVAGSAMTTNTKADSKGCG